MHRGAKENSVQIYRAYQCIQYFGVVHEKRMTDSCIISPDQTP
jgi:hypothetical protein